MIATCEVSTVYPSGLDSATVLAPMLPPAPPRLSTTAAWPMISGRRVVTSRAVASLPPPGGEGGGAGAGGRPMAAAGPARRAMRRQWQDERGAEHGKQTTWQDSWNRNGQRRAERKQCLASVASSVRCRRLRAAIGAQRKAQRAANTSIPSVLASAATPRCASMASADRQMIDDR